MIVQNPKVAKTVEVISTASAAPIYLGRYKTDNFDGRCYIHRGYHSKRLHMTQQAVPKVTKTARRLAIESTASWAAKIK